MEPSTTVHFDHPLTQSEIEELYASSCFLGDPTLVFEEITLRDWKVSIHPQHTMPISSEEFKRLLRFRLHCHTD
jgi:hypothetical protein